MEKPHRKCKCPRKDSTPINVPIIWIIGGPGSGELIRAAIAQNRPEDNTLVQTVKAGKLVPSEYILKLIKKEILKQLKDAKGFLIDGYPRERDQGILFEKTIGPVDLIIFFEASVDTLKTRILQRAQTSGRLDDNEETLQKRLETYFNLKDDLIEAFRRKMKIIDANGTPEDIFKESHVH
ncbi:hypothetical protein QE152_g159 [Popillia japonica]|uniref:Adenylate kinase n=1 Tax=Popillia japonica TaxID=7064 RepID=A0AAW1NLM7_POPJA